MGELHKEHRAEMADHGVNAGFESDARFLGSLLNDETRNVLEQLPRNNHLVACWLSGWSGF